MDTVRVTRKLETDSEVDYLVQRQDGMSFELDFTAEVVDCWKQQLSQSGQTVVLDEIAERLAEDILAQDPPDDTLAKGFLISYENGFATPFAAEERLRNTGVVSFVKH